MASLVRYAPGINAYTGGAFSSILIDNSGDLAATGGDFVFGIYAYTEEDSSSIEIRNSGDLEARAGAYAYGIDATTSGEYSSVLIKNSGDITALADDLGVGAYGIDGEDLLRRSGDVPKRRHHLHGGRQRRR